VPAEHSINLSRLLLAALPPLCYRLTANAPVVCVNLIDDHDCCRRILAQNFGEKIGYSLDERSFLIRGSAFPGYLNIDIRHGSPLYFFSDECDIFQDSS